MSGAISAVLPQRAVCPKGMESLLSTKISAVSLVADHPIFRCGFLAAGRRFKLESEFQLVLESATAATAEKVKQLVAGRREYEARITSLGLGDAHRENLYTITGLTKKGEELLLSLMPKWERQINIYNVLEVLEICRYLDWKDPLLVCDEVLERVLELEVCKYNVGRDYYDKKDLLLSKKTKIVPSLVEGCVSNGSLDVLEQALPFFELFSLPKSAEIVPRLKKARDAFLMNMVLRKAAEKGNLPEQIKLLQDKGIELSHFCFAKDPEIKTETFLKLLQAFPKVESIDFTGCHSLSGREVGTALESSMHLHSLILSFADQLAKEMAPHLPKIPTLRVLDLSDCRSLTTAAFGSHLEQVVSLEEINLSRCTQMKDIFPHLTKLTALRSLRLFWPGPARAVQGGISVPLMTACLGALTKLESFTAEGIFEPPNPINDWLGPDIVKALPTGLKRLNLSGKHLSMGSEITRLQNLEEITWKGAVEDGQYLGSLRKLNHISLTGPITDQIVDGFKLLPALGSLFIESPLLTDQVGVAISQLPLRSLEVADCRCEGGDTLSKHLQTMSKLTHLAFSSPAKLRFKDAFCAGLAKMPWLESLKLPGAPSLTRASAFSLIKLRNLRFLDVSGGDDSSSSLSAELFSWNFYSGRYIQRMLYLREVRLSYFSGELCREHYGDLTVSADRHITPGGY